MALSKLDKKIITVVSQDIPLFKKPFEELASRVGVDEQVLLSRLAALRESGLMRKFSAVVNHRKMGFAYNAMVAWDIPRSFIEKAGNLMASFTQVSHCYERKKGPRWNFNLYSMIHGRSAKECLRVVSEISRKTSCRKYKVLFSLREYKKSAVQFQYEET